MSGISSRLSRSALTALGFLAGALVIHGAALADGDPATNQVPMLLPYQGTLELDGAAVSTEDFEMKFDIYDGPSSATSVWSETHSVDVHGGRFSVLLGSLSSQSASDLVAVIQNADDLYVGITLTPSTNPVVLDGKKRLVPTAYAMWSTAQADVTVNHNLTVGNNATVTNRTTTDTLVATTLASATTVHVSDHLNFAAGGSMKGLRYTDEYTATSTSGPTPAPVLVELTPVANSLCFITQNNQSHHHGTVAPFPTTALCGIISDGETWSLHAFAWAAYLPTGGPSIDLTCKARCLEWDW